jgi:hypothetical protein
MSKRDMQRVYRLLKIARERGIIPWSWIVDEGREIERVPVWNDPEEFAECAARGYRRDHWNQQPIRCLVVSEKGTVRGLLKPVLDKYGVGFLPVHGFSSATKVNELATDTDRRPLIILYVGDYDPSGMYMSERDLPQRFARYGGDHVTIKRIAVTREQTTSLQSFPASDKSEDTRYPWFVRNYGDTCWELDAMDPNDLRDTVEATTPRPPSPQPVGASEACPFQPARFRAPPSLLQFALGWPERRAKPPKSRQHPLADQLPNPRARPSHSLNT